MKYELPKSVKRHSFYCSDVKCSVNFSKCTNCKTANNKDFKQCWKNKLIEDLKLDCDVVNEKESENYLLCPNCNSEDMVGCAFDLFMCSKCGKTITLNKSARKKLIKENYKQIDFDELSLILNKI